MRPGGPAVAGTLTLTGQSAIAVHVQMLPAPPEGGNAAERLVIMAGPSASSGGFMLRPLLSGPGPMHAPAPEQTSAVRLFVDHGQGFTDFGPYERITPPMR